MAELLPNWEQNIEHVGIYIAEHRTQFSCIAGALEHPIAGVHVQHRNVWLGLYTLIIIFLYCMFYQLLCVQHSCSSTQSWGSVLQSIVETRDQNSWGCPLPFTNRNLGSFMCIGDRNPIHPQPLGSCGPLQE